ncbi:MAG: response regulator [Treponema sp.]|nr:response regulator [Treponema sp.]
MDTLAAQDNQTGQSAGSARRKILVVDDDPLMLRAIRGWLSENYDVSVVTSAQTALAFLKKFVPDLILLDCEMPVTSGPQLFKILRDDAATSAIPVIFLTGKDDNQTLTEIHALGADGCILKTCRPDEINQSIAAFFTADERAQTKG